jgi:SAM-dependent methyltransferase
MTQDTVVNDNAGVYYAGRYWNDLPQVLAYMCEHFTGDPRKWWVQDFLERYAREPFDRMLVLNCGNGWVERELIDRGLARQAVAFDYSQDLLREASRQRGSRPIAYFRADANRVDFQDDAFDLVVNVAALHHVQYIHRFSRVLCRAMRANGVMVSFDYIGPGRNQYSWRHWRHIRRANRLLPAHLRKRPLVRHSLATMLADDPTEAIHSDLILPALACYFDLVERHDTGGGVAYEVLTHNSRIWEVPIDELTPHVSRVLEMDRHLCARGDVPPMFSYFIARPLKARLDPSVVARTEREEERREARAKALKGTYSYAEYGRAYVLPQLRRRFRGWYART